MPVKYYGHAIVPPPLPGKRALQALDRYPRTLIELDRTRGGLAIPWLVHAGARLIAPRLQLWRLSSRRAQALLPNLVSAHLVRSVTPDYPLRSDRVLTHFLGGDPLVQYQWWIPAIGADQVEPPGPGIPITVIDTGLDTAHEEFSSRPNTVTLNGQDISAPAGEEWHGTAVASVAAAPTNGVGVVGVYPQAALQAWDASPNSAGQLTVGDEVRGLVAAIGRGRSVINLSLGASQYLPIEEEAVLAAFGTGSLVVVAAGNERQKGNPLDYPASYNHVLTVGSTDTTDAVSAFSNSSPYMDLAAPGESIPAAVFTDPTGYAAVSGTSFATPLVAGASAAVWTRRPTLKNTQLFDLMRWTARDVGPPGWDPDTGFGVLNIPAATSSKAPAVDPQEPNEDIFLVKPKGLFRSGHPPLTFAGHGNAALSARLDSSEDPEDVYRVWVPKKSKVSFSLKPNANVNVAVWGPKTKSVFEKGKALKRDLIVAGVKPGKAVERVAVRNAGPGAYVYFDAFLGKNVGDAAYTLAIKTARL
jgi:Subtilase family